jgi:transcriptional regulator with XRE-family HTH domain
MTTGQRIARLRRERGLSQSGLAAALAAASGRSTITREEISRWERDRRTPTPYWLSHLAAVLRVPAEALRRPTAGPWPDGVADAAAEALDWLVSEPPQVTARCSGRRVGKALAYEVQARVARLRHLDDTLPGHDLAPLAVGEFDATAALIKDASFTDNVGRSLLASLGEAGQILGWIEADMGLHQAAQAHYLAGLRAARQGGDVVGAANIVSCIAYMQTDSGNPRDGRLLAAAAVQGAAGRVPALAEALLRERLGYANAHAGDAPGAVRALGPVDDLIETGTAGREDQPEWTYWLDHDEADVMAARCATRLGRASAAVPLIQAALGRYSTEHRREMALYWSFLAEAYLRAGQRAEAADAIAIAAGYADGTASARVSTRITGMRRTLGLSESGDP